MSGAEREPVLLTVRVATPSVAASYEFWQSVGARTLLSRKDARVDVPLGPGVTLEASEEGPAVPTLVGRSCDARFAAALAAVPGGRKRGSVWVWEHETVAAVASLAPGRTVQLWRSVAGPERRVRVVVGGEAAVVVGAVLPGLGLYRPDRAVAVYRRGPVEVVLEDDPATAVDVEVLDPEADRPGETMRSPSGVGLRRVPAAG